MAESFEPYHVPQQSRRDKLRGLALPDNLVSLYHDPSINIPSSDHFPTYYMDPQDINTNPFLYTPQNLKYLDDTCNTNTNNAHQGLSLSLSSIHHTTNGSTSNNYLSKSNTTCHVPLGPFTGYSLILKRSKFLKPAQILLEELCDVGSKGIYAEKLADDDLTLLLDSPLGVEPQIINGDEHVMRKKSRLISMLDEVYQKYKQYYQQLQMVVASFESVAGLGNAAPFANIALKAMSKNFKCLKDAITDQLQFTSKSHSPVNCERVEVTGKELYCQRRAIHSAGFADRTQPVWRPQRGLPERAVTVLRAWLFDHFLHPYPTDTDKVMLAKQTGLSRNQVSNWFINARVRLWKPMVEEIHMLETREGHNKTSQIDQGQNNNNNPIEHFPTSSNSHPCDQTPSTSAPRIQDIPSKRTRNDLANVPIGSNMMDSINLSYGNLSTGTGGVSLTLGLHQDTGNIGLSEPFPINAARRFGIDSNSDHRFMVSSFEEQNGQYGRNMISGQFLQDFAS